MANAKAKKPNGRPPKVLDWEEIAKLAAIQCTIAEVASICECSRVTLDAAAQREFGVSFCTWYDDKRAVGKISLRRMMYQNAQKGNTTMQIFLSKQSAFLGFADKVEQQIEHSGEVQGLTPEQRKAIHQDPEMAQAVRKLARGIKSIPGKPGEGESK